ncbi:hypothetical protein HED60_14930 [Planctomycetales bacterium ZRK34]|nr:hypothetical protein HED60_14930 [Planctomycetales bacterium ZRK34]
MPNAEIPKATIFEDSGAICMARVLGNAGTAITQASLNSIECSVFNQADTSTAVTEPSITIADVVFDTLQTSDPRWTEDDTGYNFLIAVPATAFPAGGATYHVEFKFTPASGEPFHIVFEIETRAINRS